MTPRVSVVVPVHNAAAYLERCLTSLLTQTWNDLEVIVVDDGSIDDSLQRSQAVARHDDRVTVLHQSNAGVSAARNYGLSAASGEFVTFLDADDWAEPDTIEQLVGCADNARADVVVAGCWVDFVNHRDTVMSSRQLLAEKSNELGIGPAPLVTPELTTLIGYAWNKLYRRDLLERISARFPVGQPLYEDLRFAADVLTASQRVAVLDKALVHYVQRGEATGGTRFVQDFLELRLLAIADQRRVYLRWGVSCDEVNRATARWQAEALRNCVRRVQLHETWGLHEKAVYLRGVRTSSSQVLAQLSWRAESARWHERVYASAFKSLPPVVLLASERLRRGAGRACWSGSIRKVRS